MSEESKFDFTMTNQTAPVRVVMASDKQRQGIRWLLETEPAVRVVGEAATGAEALSLVYQLTPDILILDLKFCRVFEALPYPFKTRIIVLLDESTTAVERAHIVEAFQRGAQAVVPRAAANRLLLQSIRSVMAGRYWLEDGAIGVLVEALRELSVGSDALPPYRDYGLTEREQHIVEKVARGLSNKELSREFSITERTVKHHLTNIFAKLGVSNRTELALFAINHRLASDVVTSSGRARAASA